MYQHADSISCKLVLLEDESVWLVRYTHDNTYGLPGGRMHQGETPQQAAQREVHEEIGAKTTSLRLVDAWLIAKDPRRDGQDCLVLVYGGRLKNTPTTALSSFGEQPVKIRVSDIDNLDGLAADYKQAVKKVYNDSKGTPWKI